MFAINPNIDKKLFVVNNFYSNPDAVRDYALRLEYVADLRYYKGLRSVGTFLFPGIKEAFERIMGIQIHDWNSGPNGCFQITSSSDPQVYHYDQQKWAAMIYLTPDAPVESGTRLIRNRLNHAGHVNDPGIDQAFTGGFLDSTKFDTVDSAGNLYNRLVIMDAQSIHCAGPYFGQSREDSRLVHLFFFN